MLISSTRPSSTCRALLGILVAVAMAAGFLTAPSAEAAATTPQAASAGNWLKGQLARQDPFRQSGFPSYGPTLDAFFALRDLRMGPRARQDVLDVMEPDTYAYVAGSTPRTESYAGPTGKLLSAVQAQGLDPATYARGNLLPRLESLVVTSGAEAGRAKDKSQYGDYSNVIGQAWVVRALSVAGSSRAGATVTFLLKQQCSAGYFREGMDSADFTCDGGTADQKTPSVDATAYAVRALLVARNRGVVAASDVAAPLRDAAAWLASVQRPNGAFTGVGGASANSTGLAGVALDALGRSRRAELAAEWLQRHQVTARLARRTALRMADVGAIAPTGADLRAAKADGITAPDRIRWRLATAQAAPALEALGAR